ncbi:hypothetical protein GOP47_0002790 [Adiantum capillus-veneris]|uniref:Uncharacterized protein n=1 Tax=Adiantum capillus-veneris TaxID=13818 RepID=A0A9D4ZRL8_ADICA|nr:hypothetical protein GOP47_0002790 [Adiantum capillus-veneris]
MHCHRLCTLNNNSNGEVREEVVGCMCMRCGSREWMVRGADGQGQDVGSFTSATTNSDPLMLLRKVVLEDHALVTSLALTVSVQSFGCIQIAIGKVSGSIVVTEAFREEDAEKEAFKVDAHSQTVTGLLWAFDGRCLYSCSQDNSLHAWKLSRGGLLALPFPEDARRKTKKNFCYQILYSMITMACAYLKEALLLLRVIGPDV